MKDQNPISLIGENFDGLYARGVSGTSYNPDGATPRETGFTEANQIRWTPWGCQARPGYDTLSILASAGTIKQKLNYHTNDTTTGAIIDGYLLVTHNAGSTFVYDSNSATPTVAIDSIAGSYYVSLICIFGRVIFTYHDYDKGTNSSYQVLKPGAVASRDNGGSGPSLVGVNFASSGTAGNVTQGIHVFGLAYQTDTGHITALSTFPTTDVNIFTLANANEQVTVTGLPSPLPSGMSKVLVVGSRVIPSYTGSPIDYPIFFIPGAESTGASASITFDFTDESLVDSADYLYDLFGTLYSQLGFTWYANRLIGWGEGYYGGASIGPSNLRISLAGLPESFSLSSGILPVYPDDGSSGVKNAWEYKGLLIIQKDNKTFVTRDNGDEPNTWGVEVLDGTIGGVLNGVSRSIDTVGNTRTEFVSTLSKSGIYPFDGKFPDIPLTWKIERLWQELSESSDFKKYQIIDIPTAKLFIVLVSHNDEFDDWRFLVCDYSRGMSYQTVRWSVWYPSHEPIWISVWDNTNFDFVRNNTSADVYRMPIGLAATERLSDNSEDITDGSLITAELPFGNLERSNYIGTRAQGEFTGVSALNWIDDSNSTALLQAAFPTALNNSGDITQIKYNKMGFFPKFQIEFSTSYDPEFPDEATVFRLKRLVFYGKMVDQDLVNP